jgi:hypothetical protein
MVLDHQVCNVIGCDLHYGWSKETPAVVRNEQIRDDWKSGHWMIEELAFFWGLKPESIFNILRKTPVDF